ncbi:uncharacterized protein LOC133175012 [Saccostrea echinata]|uniref:uncharacterized protein LOC133175012 n=1 Tax=Saccostrea echinata TaxID=191078 RepID=UPI002A835245|nr:uncharacterized protein LOC133175012 [Saccostrea echinata]
MHGEMIVGQPIRRNNTDLPLYFSRNYRKYHGNNFLKEASYRRLYYRLTDPLQPVSLVRGRYLADNGPLAKFFKENEHSSQNSKCTCHENTNRCLRNALMYTTQTRNNRNDTSLHPASLIKQDIINKRLQLPYSTIVVRWQRKRDINGYNLPDLMSVLSQYGAIRYLRMLSPNSALVVFEELSSSCNIMQHSVLGDSNKLYCKWWHKCMENKFVYLSKRGIKVIKDPFISVL